MREYKYRELLAGNPVWEPLVKELLAVRSACLRPCAKAFHANMERNAAFAILPAEVAFRTFLDSLFILNFLFKSTGQTQITIDELISSRALLASPEFLEHLVLQRKQLDASQAKLETYFDVFGANVIEETLKKPSEDPGVQTSIQDGMDAILSSVVLDSWTAFESLAGDLWVATVDNEKGEAVGRLIAASARLKNPDKNIRPETVLQSGINAKEKYGSFLRAMGCVSFQTLHDIKDYYAIAFEKDAARLFDEVKNGYIEVLSAFRNVLTHTAGRADAKFAARLHGRFKEFDSIKEGDLIELDGELVNRLNMVSLNLGLALIKYMDDLLSPLPDEAEKP